MKFKAIVKLEGKNAKARQEILDNATRLFKKEFHRETERIAGVYPHIIKVGLPMVKKKEVLAQVQYENPRELNLYGEPLPCRVKPLLLPELKKYATSLGIKGSQTMKKEKLISLICEIKGYDQKKEPAEVIEYLVAGGRVKEYPPQKAAPIKPSKTTQALQKPAKKTRTRVRKPRGESTTRPVSENQVSLQMILEELGVSPRIARRKLRGSDIKKPGAAWVWDKGHKDIAKVKELLK